MVQFYNNPNHKFNPKGVFLPGFYDTRKRTAYFARKKTFATRTPLTNETVNWETPFTKDNIYKGQSFVWIIRPW